MAERRGLLRVLGSATRLIHPRDILYHVGNLMYRRSLRYTALSVGIGLLGWASHLVGIGGLSVRQAITLPLAVGSVALLGGLGLRSFSTLISSRLLTLAQASDLNLMEDYRKSRVDEHLDALWQRVFRHEWPHRSPAVVARSRELIQRHKLLNWTDEGPEPPPRRQYLALARFALHHALPLPRQRYTVGIDLGYLEDWRDGAPLDASNTKLAEQFDGSAALQAVRSRLRFSLSRTLGHLQRRIVRRLWFLMTTRALAIQTAEAVAELNELHQTDSFNCQVLLWPGEEDEPWLAEMPGARRQVLDRRRRILRRIFGPTAGDALDLLDRMQAGTLELAAELRIACDGPLCQNQLKTDLLADLADAGLRPSRIERLSRQMQRNAEDLERFTRWIHTHRPDLLTDDGATLWQAARAAFLLDEDRLRTKLTRCWNQGRDQAVPTDIHRWIDRVAQSADRCRHHLLCVRMHYELARLERLESRRLVETLGYSAVDKPRPEGVDSLVPAGGDRVDTN